MYCVGCGNEINAGLNYCKSCGMRLASDEKARSSNRILTTLLITFGVITVVGLGILIALIALLLDRGASELIFGITIVFYVTAFTAIEFILGMQLSKLINAGVKNDKNLQTEFVQPMQFPSRNTAQLPEPTAMPFSVTDNTTRIFDKVPRTEN